jgi:ABC-2 type transport system permease protein
MSSLNLQKELNKVYAFAYRNVIITRRNFFTIFEMLFWPLVSLSSVGLMGSYLRLGEEQIAFILIGAISLSVIQLAQLDITYVLLFDVWSKSLKYTFASPLSFLHMLLGSWSVGILRGFVAFVVLTFFSASLFNLNLAELPIFNLLSFLFGLFVNAMLVGMAVCILLLIFGRRAEIAAWTLTAIIMLVCGIYYPVSVLPSVVRHISYAIPVTHFLEYFRSFYGFQPAFSDSMVIGFLISAIYFIAGIVIYNVALKRARKRGTLLRLSE